MGRSAKTAVIEYLFFNIKGYIAGQDLADAVVTFDDIEAAIDATHSSLKKDNKANFWKDITRADPNRIWPTSVRDAGYTGADAIGRGAGTSFEFVRMPEGQEAAFPGPPEPSPEALNRTVALESVSMPLATKALGRTDENWLAQVGVRLRVIETHFALVSSSGAKEITFLQTGVKLGRGEVDAAYSLIDRNDHRWLLAIEAKGRRERIHVPQVQRAAAALLSAARRRGQDVRGVIPMGMKIIGVSTLHIVEFDPDTGGGSRGRIVSDSVIELRPEVTGID